MNENENEIRKTRARRERASARLEAAHTGLKATVVQAVRSGAMGPKEAAELAGVSRQSVHDWLKDSPNR